MKKLPLIFCIIVFIELYFLISVGASLGVLTTIALFVVSSFLGIALIRWQGTATALNISRQFAQGIVPKVNILKSLIMLFAGILLILPGFFTDFVGICFFVYGLIRQLFTSPGTVSSAHTQYRDTEHNNTSRSEPRNTDKSKRHTTIDGEYKREDD